MSQPPLTITDQQISQLKHSLANVPITNKKQLYQALVNAPFNDRLLTATVDLGIIVLLLVDTSTNMLDRIALSDTEHAHNAVRVSARPFHEIHIPMDTKNNVLVNVIKDDAPQVVSDWQYLFTPILSPVDARKNQSAASIECSLVWPIRVCDGGALIFSFYQPPAYISDEHKIFAKKYAAIVQDCLQAI